MWKRETLIKAPGFLYCKIVSKKGRSLIEKVLDF